MPTIVVGWTSQWKKYSPSGTGSTGYSAVAGPVISSPVTRAGASASGPSNTTTLWGTAGSWLSKAIVNASSLGTERASVENPVAAAPSGAAIATTTPPGSPPPSSSASRGAATTARPPATIAMPAIAATIENSVPPVTRLREATHAATTTMPAAATSATRVAASCETASSTRENPNSTSAITTSTPIGIRIGSSRLCRFLPSLILALIVGTSSGTHPLSVLIGHRDSSAPISRCRFW